MQLLADSNVVVPPPPVVHASESRRAVSVGGRGQMLPIAGADDLLQILRVGTARRYSGELHLTSATGRGQVCLYNGGIAWAQCTTWPEHLGDVLTREAGIDRVDLERAMAHCREAGCKLGHGLVRLGLIDYGQLRRCLGLHVRAHLEEVLLLDVELHGRFDLVPDRHYDRALTFTLSELVP